MVRVRQGATFYKSVQKYPHYESATPSWVLDFQVRQQGKPQNIYYDPAHASSHDFLYKPMRLRRQYTARNNCAYSQAGAFFIGAAFRHLFQHSALDVSKLFEGALFCDTIIFGHVDTPYTFGLVANKYIVST